MTYLKALNQNATPTTVGSVARQTVMTCAKLLRTSCAEWTIASTRTRSEVQLFASSACFVETTMPQSLQPEPPEPLIPQSKKKESQISPCQQNPNLVTPKTLYTKTPRQKERREPGPWAPLPKELPGRQSHRTA